MPRWIGCIWALFDHNYATYYSSYKLWSLANVWHDRKWEVPFLKELFLLQCRWLCRFDCTFFFVTVCNILDVLIYSPMFYWFDLLNLLNVWSCPICSLVIPNAKSHKILFFFYNKKCHLNFLIMNLFFLELFV